MINTMATIEERTELEKQRLTALLFEYNIPEKKVNLVTDTISNVAWIKVKLEDTRDTIRHTDVAIPYDNGGGQAGIRENPLFKGYEALFKSYMQGMKILLDLLPEEEARVEDENKPKTVLELVREKHA